MEMAAFRGTQRFEVRSCLGAGGMGIVYEVRDRVLGRSVAAKTLRKMTPRGLVRFKREFRALRDLRHPNLVRFGELYEDQGQWFFTMELLRGGELLDQLRVPSSRATTTEAMATTSHVDGAAAAAMATVVDEPTSLRPAASAGAGDAVDDAAAAAPVRTDWQQVRRAFAQARAHGLVSERDVGSYVDLTVLFGVGFDEPPAIAAIFTTPDRLAVERVDAVYELLGDPPEPPPANAR